MRRLIVLVLLVVGCARGAEALSLRDLMELSRAGLGDEVLLALIEVNRGVYPVDRATLVSLKEAGVSDRVIAALIRSGREAPPQPEPWWGDEPPPAAAPPVVVIEHHAPPQIQQIAVPVPIYVPVPAPRPKHHTVRHTPIESTYVPFQTGPPTPRPTTPVSSPVYWGFDGTLRPDAWGQPPKADPPKPDGSKADDSRAEAPAVETSPRARRGRR